MIVMQSFRVPVMGSRAIPSGPINSAPLFSRLDDSSGAVFSDALILPTSLDLSKFNNRQFFVFFDDQGTVSTLSGTITGLDAPANAVPEPSSIALSIFGIAGLGLIRKRMRIASPA